MTIIACYNIKGGVGKTASAVNLAHLAASEGAKTLLWDLDPQGASTFYCLTSDADKTNVKRILRKKSLIADCVMNTDYDNLDLLPADISYRNLDIFLEQKKNPDSRIGKALKFVIDKYDFVFLDCPPSFSTLSENIFRTADVVLVPTIPTTLSLRTLGQLQAFCADQRKLRKKIIPFFSMVDRRKAMHKLITEQPPNLNLEFLHTAIPYASEVERMGIERKPVVQFAKSSAGAKAYASLWRELLSRL